MPTLIKSTEGSATMEDKEEQIAENKRQKKKQTTLVNTPVTKKKHPKKSIKKSWKKSKSKPSGSSPSKERGTSHQKAKNTATPKQDTAAKGSNVNIRNFYDRKEPRKSHENVEDGEVKEKEITPKTTRKDVRPAPTIIKEEWNGNIPGEYKSPKI